MKSNALAATCDVLT